MVSLFENDHAKLTRLMKKMREGDTKAAGELYDYLLPKVFGFCMIRVKNRMTAEDITQDIFVKLIEKADSFDETKGQFLSWFWSVARNTLIDALREKKSVAISDNEEDETINIPHNENLEHILDTKQRLQELRAFLETLSIEEQQLFELRFIAELSYEEMAVTTNKKPGALRVAVSRLKDKVEQKFKPI